MRKLIIILIRFYFLNIPVRKGKIPLLNFLSSIGLFKGITMKGEICGVAKANLKLEDWVQKLVYFFGIYEFEKAETRAWIKLLKKDCTIIDIGANFGYYSLITAGVDNSIKVISFEPSPEMFSILNWNINLNKFKNIDTYQFGVSDKSGFLNLYVANDQNSGMTSLAMPSNFNGEVVQVEVINIDRFLNVNGLNNIALIKVDVEGSELKVLHGMIELIKKHLPVVFIELIDQYLKRFSDSTCKVFEYFSELNYEIYEYNKRGELTKIDKPRDVELAICIHKSNNSKIIDIIK